MPSLITLPVLTIARQSDFHAWLYLFLIPILFELSLNIGHLEKLISPFLEKPTTLEVSLDTLNSSIGFSIELN
jgi:hypothetical protein